MARMPSRRPYKPSTRGSSMGRGSSSKGLGRHKHTSSLFFLMLAGALLFLALLFHAHHQQPPDPIPQQQLQQQPPPPQVGKQEKETREVIKEAARVDDAQAVTVRTAQEKGRRKKWVSELVSTTTYVHIAPLPPLSVPPSPNPLPSPHLSNTGLSSHHHPRHLLPRPQNRRRVRATSAHPGLGRHLDPYLLDLCPCPRATALLPCSYL